MAIKFLSGLDLEVTSSVLKTDANGVIIAAVAGTDYAAASHTHSYLPLAGGTLTGNVRLNDSVQLQIGSSNDAYITHNGTNTYFVNGVGNLEITNDTTDGDIIFKSDNGSGGLTTYFFLDGGSVATQFNQRALFIDNIAAEFGSSRDLKIYHDGSNSYVENDTGDLYIRSNFQDRDIILQSDNGGGGIATYIQIDGSTGAVDLNHYGTKKLETTSTGVTVTGNARVTGAYYDSSNTPGTVNQLLSSTVTGTTWIDPSTITAEAATLVVIACKNTSGATIAKGTPVYQTGTVGATATIEIATADALISSGKLPAIGLLQTTLNNNGLGFVVISGALTNFTTSPIDGVVPTTGDKVFVKSGGGLTLTKPTGEGNGIQNMGLVGKVSSGSAGTITVSSIMRTNDVPNLPEGRIWVGDGNTLVSDTVYVDEPNLRLGIGTTTPGTTLDVSGVITATGGTSTQWNTAYTYSQVGHLPLAGGTLTGDIDMAAGKGITFYGNGSADHGIFGKDSAGNSSDDIRINSYHSVHVNLDSNSNNNSSSTFFTIGEHGGTGTIGANVFSVDGSGNTVIAGDVVVSGGDITLEGTGRIQGVDTVSAATDAANKGYVDDSITDLIGGAPGTLDTLNELAAAINDDASYATTLTSALATKLPLAGGTLTGDVTFTGATHHAMWDKSASALEFWDNAKLTFGDPGGTPDLQIYHDGSHSYIQDVGTGNLNITSSGGSVQINKGLSENMAEFIVDGAVNLYYDSAKKFETTSTGVAVTGNLDSPQISVNDYISHNGDSNTYFGFPTADNIDFVAGGNLNFVVNANQTYLRYQGSTKLTTSSTGVTVTGLMQASTIGVTNIVTNKVVKFNGSILDDSNITDTGSLITLGSNTTVTGNLTLSGGSSIIDQGTIYIQDVAGGRIGFNRNTSNGNIHNSGYNAFQLQSNTNDVDGKFEIQAYQGSDGVSGGSFYINKAAQPLINDYILHYGDENTKIGFSSSDTFIVHTGGTTALTVDSSQNATFAGDVNLAAGKKIKYSANSFMTPENNVSGAEISTAGTFIVKTGTTPTLGLTLDSSQNATFAGGVGIGASPSGGYALNMGGHINMQANDIYGGDNSQILLGASQDLQIYHDGSNSYIKDTGTGNLEILADSLSLLNAAGSEYYARFYTNGSAYLYHNGVAKLNTTSTGVTVTGGWVTDGVSVATANVEHTDNTKSVFGTGNDLQIYHDGSHSYIRDQGSGNLIITGSQLTFSNVADTEYMAKMVQDGTVELYYNGSKKFETYSTGAGVTGNLYFTSGSKIHFDNGVSNSYYIEKSSTTLTFNTGGTYVFNTGDATFAGAIKSTRAPGANHGDPTIALGDGNTGFYERSDNDLRVSIGGSGLWEFSSNCMGSVSEGKAHFNNETATATNPSIIPWRNDADTGIGRGSANVLSLIAGGTEALSLSTTTATFAGSVTVAGDLTVNGTTTTINTATVEVEDNILQLNTTQGSPDTATAATSGISIYRGNGVTQASLIFDDADDTWDLTNNLVVGGNAKVSQSAANVTTGPALRVTKGASPIGSIRYDTLVVEANDVATIRIGESDGTVSSMSSGDNNFRINSTDPIKFYTAGTTTGEAHGGQGGTFAMIIDNSQNVGIGDSSPSYKLDVNGTGRFTGVLYANTYVNTPAVYGTTVSVGSAAGGSPRLNFSATGITTQGTGDISLLSGDVGIGTTSPKAKLDVNGGFCVDSKTHNLTNAFTTCLTVNLNSHTGCYVTLTCFGDWGGHSSAAYRGEFFLQNGANGYAEPGIILRQDDNTSNGTDQIVCQIVDPTGSGNPKDFEIQIRTTATTGTTSFTGQLTYTVQGQFNSIT